MYVRDTGLSASSRQAAPLFIPLQLLYLRLCQLCSYMWRASVHTPIPPTSCGLLWLQVKSMWLVSHPLEAQVFARVGKQEFSNLLTTWQDVMLVHPVWVRLMVAAADCDYNAVAQGLADRFD